MTRIGLATSMFALLFLLSFAMQACEGTPGGDDDDSGVSDDDAGGDDDMDITGEGFVASGDFAGRAFQMQCYYDDRDAIPLDAQVLLMDWSETEVRARLTCSTMEEGQADRIYTNFNLTAPLGSYSSTSCERAKTGVWLDFYQSMGIGDPCARGMSLIEETLELTEFDDETYHVRATFSGEYDDGAGGIYTVSGHINLN